jgi:DNA mismatch endonuclease (patch repair protein)
VPKTRTGFWEQKLQKNHDRDVAAIANLLQDDWRVAVVWECAVRNAPEMTSRKLATWIREGKGNMEVEGVGGAARVAKLVSGGH